MQKIRILSIALTVLVFAAAQLASANPTNRYVCKANTSPAPPYTNWAGAATNIQDALNAAYAGDSVLVSNGVYDVGGLTNYPAGTVLTNRVVIIKAVTVQSVNGPDATIIKGARSSDGNTNGSDAIRCVYMSAGSLIGFTLTNGATLQVNQPVSGTNDNHNGGGVFCPNSTTPVISNCVIVGNSAAYYGGGTCYGTLYSCVIAGNSSCYGGGGVSYGILHNCVVSNSVARHGGGAYGSTLYNCVVIKNLTSGYGGGLYYGMAYNSILVDNSVITLGYSLGGGMFGSTLYNCTVAGNSSSNIGGGTRGGVSFNCIVYFNSAPSESNWSGGTVFTNSCTAPAQAGWAAGNIAVDPMFVNTNMADYRLQMGSSCINAGTNMGWMSGVTDLDGRSRIDRYSGVVDMGCYEYLPAGTMYSVP